MLQDIATYLLENSQDFTTALSQHLQITFIALGISILVGLLFGIIGTRIAWLRGFLLGVGKIGNTIPSLAVLALALPLLGIGRPPTLLALTFIGTLPILINTLIGIEQVDPDIKESARGMGMKDLQILFQVELPIAVSVIMAGVRTAAVVVVAGATLAGFIGGGGLGDLILRGHALNQDQIMLSGAIPATLLAFYFEETFGRLENWMTPKGLKVGQVTRQTGGLIGLLAAVTVLPLIFGVMLPWETVAGSGGASILTGLHAEYRSIGLPVLLLGLIAALWPRRGESGNAWPITIATFVAALLAFIWLVFGLVTRLPGIDSAGILALLVAVVGLAVDYRRRTGPELSQRSD